MEKIPELRLQTYIVWVPKVGGREKYVPAAIRHVPRDDRASHYWDGAGILLSAYQPALEISEDAWDVYMIYGPGARWEGQEPPRPDFWMHQLKVTNAPDLDADEFAERVKSVSIR
jgi:hypothetical protein